jgi:hypothetical protein
MAQVGCLLLIPCGLYELYYGIFDFRFAICDFGGRAGGYFCVWRGKLAIFDGPSSG